MEEAGAGKGKVGGGGPRKDKSFVRQVSLGRVIRCWVFIRVPGNRALVLQEVVPVVGVANKQAMCDMTLTFLALVELIHFHHSGCSA